MNGVWGTVCSTGFDDADASVACAQLGFSRYGRYCFTSALRTSLLVGVLHPPDNYYYYYGGPVHFYNLNCTGTESSIWECSFSNTTQYCYYAAYVICQSKLLML